MDRYHLRREYTTCSHSATQKDEMAMVRVRRSFYGGVIVLLVTWNVILHVQTSRHSEQIEHLEAEHLELRQRFSEVRRAKRSLLPGVLNDGDSQVNTAASIDEIDEIDGGSLLHRFEGENLEDMTSQEGVLSALLDRHKRATSNGQRNPRKRKRNNGNRQSKTNDKNKVDTVTNNDADILAQDSSAHVAHFAAYVDEDKLKREAMKGIPSNIGKRNADGTLTPNDDVYRFWKPAEWSSAKAFSYDVETGKVTIKRAGFYLIYGQIVFHGSSARKSYGIHVSDDLVPFIESIAFDNIMEQRTKRDVTSVDDVILSNSTMDDQHLSRHKRLAYSSYSQCNTLAVTHLRKNDTVFLKSIKPQRPIITQPYLTFWGIAKL